MGRFSEVFVHIGLWDYALGLFHSPSYVYNPCKDVCKIFSSCSFVMKGVSSALNVFLIQ